MEASFVVHKLSAIYETEPVGIDSDKKFLNMVAEIHVTNVTPSQMMARMMRIEYLLGRTDKSLKKPRTIDLDLLLFGDVVIEEDDLRVPHPEITRRSFVLVPLVELDPGLVHPVTTETMLAHLSRLGSRPPVKRGTRLWN